MPINDEAMEAVEREGLCSEASVEIFVQWYTLGGMQRGLTLTEILTAPKWLVKDFKYILGAIGLSRKENERAESLLKSNAKKSGKKGR